MIRDNIGDRYAVRLNKAEDNGVKKYKILFGERYERSSSEQPGPGGLRSAPTGGAHPPKKVHDADGNILDMVQQGVASGSVVTLDNLHYTYSATDYRLQAVNDDVTTDYGQGDFQDTYTDPYDYSYDRNGNLTVDNNKGIDEVTYTHFNKPSVIHFRNGRSIEYSYDAAGNKVQELILSDDPKRSDYISNFVFTNDSVRYALTQSGRTTFTMTDNGMKNKEEFFVKDHLGNVRSITDLYTYPVEEYLASYEIASANLENMFFERIDEVRDDKPGSTWIEDLKSARLNGGDPSRRVGTSLLVHVMSGDLVEMNVNNFYDAYDAAHDVPQSESTMLGNIVSTLYGGAGGHVGSEAHDVRLMQDLFSNTNFGDFNDLVQGTTDTTKPRAYLNYLLFDESKQLVASMSGSFQANGDNTWTAIGTTQPLVVPQNGYLAVYLSNSTHVTNCLNCGDVFFDQLVFRLSRGNLKEENHYYPFGLPINSLSSADPGMQENRRKYQSNEYIKDLGLNWMDFHARQYDPQIGRFLGVDPKADVNGQEVFNPYAAMGNAPESMVDPNGELQTKYDANDLRSKGVTTASLQQFERIVRNAGAILRDNPILLDVLSKTTGISKEQILLDFQPGNGPAVELVDRRSAHGGRGGLVIDYKIVGNLAKSDPLSDEGFLQILGVLTTVIHEYAHYGDQVTNDGSNTGQYEFYPSDRSMRTIRTNVIGTSTDKEKGNQYYKKSLTGHRGRDTDVFGFGVKVYTNDDGTFDFEPVTSEDFITKKSVLPPIPSPESTAGGERRKRQLQLLGL